MLFLGFMSDAQQLINTTWTLFDGSNNVYIYLHFKVDTAAYSLDDVSYFDVSLYEENGSNFRIYDLIGGPCMVSDTGNYSFLIQNDTLFFTSQGDSCSARETTLTQYTWVNKFAGVTEVDFTDVSVYPTFSEGQFTIAGDAEPENVELFDLSGRRVSVIYSGMNEYEVPRYEKGLHILKILTGGKSVTCKLVLQ